MTSVESFSTSAMLPFDGLEGVCLRSVRGDMREEDVQHMVHVLDSEGMDVVIELVDVRADDSSN